MLARGRGGGARRRWHQGLAAERAQRFKSGHRRCIGATCQRRTPARQGRDIARGGRQRRRHCRVRHQRCIIQVGQRRHTAGRRADLAVIRQRALNGAGNAFHARLEIRDGEIRHGAQIAILRPHSLPCRQQPIRLSQHAAQAIRADDGCGLGARNFQPERHIRDARAVNIQFNAAIKHHHLNGAEPRVQKGRGRRISRGAAEGARLQHNIRPDKNAFD